MVKVVLMVRKGGEWYELERLETEFSDFTTERILEKFGIIEEFMDRYNLPFGEGDYDCDFSSETFYFKPDKGEIEEWKVSFYYE